jgi:DNA-binding SARP family transcriptional activator
MAQLALFFLGPPRIERDGIPITVDTRKAIALMVYLVMTRQRCSRDALAGLLWPDYDQAK